MKFFLALRRFSFWKETACGMSQTVPFIGGSPIFEREMM